MAWTQDDVDKLKTSIASGVLIVSYDGPPKRLVQYQTIDAMLKALALMQFEVETAAGTRISNRYASASKGFG